MQAKLLRRVHQASALILLWAALAAFPTAVMLSAYAVLPLNEKAACCCGTAEPLCSSDCSIEESAEHAPVVPAQTVNLGVSFDLGMTECAAPLNAIVSAPSCFESRAPAPPPPPLRPDHLSRAPPV